MGQPDEVRAKLAQLAERFIQRTMGETVSLRDLVSRARGGDAAAFTELRNLAHRMQGTGATLGFTDIGEQAARIERLAEDHSTDFDTMDACIAKIDELLQAAAAKTGAPGRS